MSLKMSYFDLIMRSIRWVKKSISRYHQLHHCTAPEVCFILVAKKCPPDLVPCDNELMYPIIIRSQGDKASTRTTNRKDEMVVIPNERPNIIIATFFDTLILASGLSGASPPELLSVSLSSSPDGR